MAFIKSCNEISVVYPVGHLSPLYRIDQGCENVSVVTVLYAVFGFDRICFRFFGFG